MVIPRPDKKPEGNVDGVDDLPPFAQSEPPLEQALVRIGQPNVCPLSAVTLLDASHAIEQSDNTRSDDTTPDRHQRRRGIVETDERTAVQGWIGQAGHPRRIEGFDAG
ncbi:MAG: hypothetical protein ABSF33_13155 [Acidimicrobiales bacterium]